MINTKIGSTKRAFAIYRYLLLASNYFQQISERNGIGQSVELPNEKPALLFSTASLIERSKVCKTLRDCN